MRILGPNTVGSANAFTGFTTSPFKQTDFRRRPIGVVCQTGMFFGTLGRARLLGKGLDIGNAADIDLAEAVEYFAEDPEVKVIILHMEGAADGRRFMESASRVTRRKPVVVMKTAHSERAAVTAQTHTGSVVGSDHVWNAALRQCGVIRASTPSELGDLARAFAYLPLMQDRGTGIISGSGGVGIMAMDACAGHGLDVPRLSSTVKEGFRDLCPPWFEVENPVDLWPVFIGSNRPLAESLQRLLRGVLSQPDISGVVLFAGAWFESLDPPLTEIIGTMADAWPGKPVALCPYEGWVYDITAHDLAGRLEDMGKGAVFSIPEEAVAVLASLADYAEFLRDSRPKAPDLRDAG
ncbi:MAG: hypothetical protein IBX68_07480 [Dehalococcoidia bacterium]|nr:hypothetical protein [Dehalococcoidia bacterium]